MILPVTVMIADDESAIRNGLTEIVSNLELNVSVVGCADNGKDALTLIRKFQPDIAIMDISMPELNGMEVIRIAVEEKITTYFFILSGYSDFEYAQKAIRYGVKSYFLKPLNLVDFREVFSKQCREIMRIRNNSDLISNKDISTLIDSSRTLLLNQLIQKRFYRADDIAEKLQMLHLEIQNEDNSVIVFLLSLSGEKAGASEIEQEALYHLFPGYPSESWCYAENQIVSIVNTADTASGRFRESVYQAIYAISALGYSVKAGIGSVVEHLGLSYVSYSNALEALSYRIYDADTVLFDSAIISREKPSFATENIDCKPLIYAMTHQSKEKIVDYVDAFFDMLFSGELPPPNYVIGMCMYLIINVQKQLEMLYSDVKLDFELSYEKLYHFNSIRKLHQWITDIMIDYSALLAASAVDRNGIIRAAKEYIQNNLDKNIKAKDVAEQVHLSESYFTIYFKNKTGTNFRDYVLKARIALAQKLLASGEINISEIAYRVGYQDYRSFSRAFKNETGMSPSEYMNTK